MTVTSVVIAHQGGWDELLLIVAPVVLIVAILAIAKRRVDAAADARRRANAPGHGRQPAESRTAADGPDER